VSKHPAGSSEAIRRSRCVNVPPDVTSGGRDWNFLFTNYCNQKLLKQSHPE